MTLLEQIVEATVEGDTERCVALARQSVDEGVDPHQVLREGYTRGMKIVGDRFATLEIFMPQMMDSAAAMSAAMEVLKPHLEQRKDRGSQGTVLLGTIQGDVHEIGKNIVKIMLRSSGFTVDDLGCDVPVRQFVERAREAGPDIIAVSALLTTTMTHIPDLIRILTELGLRDEYRVMIGGAPVTAEWAAEIGADGYADDASEAAEVAQRLMQDRKRGEKR
jgi:5-methyltetrahydrofolate--homocysteine methyltransferase